MKLMISLFVLSFSVSSFAKHICVATVFEEVGYASYMASKIYCQDGSVYQSRKNVTTFLLPIPYQWKKVAHDNMRSVMTDGGFKEMSKIKTNSKYLTYVYDVKSAEKQNYCIVEKSLYTVQSGLNGKVSRRDVYISCDDGTGQVEGSAVTDRELAEFMSEKGYSPLFKYNNDRFIFYTK